MNETSIKRPKPGEGEEELFHMQEDFLKSKEQPSAKVIKLHTQNTNEKNLAAQDNKSRQRLSKYERRKRRGQENKLSTSHTGGDMLHPTVSKVVTHGDVIERSFDPVKNISAKPSSILLGNIIEKIYIGEKFEFNPISGLSSDTMEMGFPKTFALENKVTDGSKSLFLQKFLQKNTMVNKSNETNSNSLSNENGSILIDGPWASEIHKANVEKLREMSKEEILKEKQRLEATLSPDILAFLKTRKKTKEQLKSKNNFSATEAPIGLDILTSTKINEKDNNVQSSTELHCTTNDNTSDTDVVMKSETESTKLGKPLLEILDQAKQKGWVHMDLLETEKFKWMEEIPVGENDSSSSEEYYNARFDFNGVLLPYKDENLTVNQGLHHHGEEPDRPGYTLQELLQLSRSATQQQRCTALSTLGNIMEKSRRGWYDKVLYPAPLSALSQKNILLLLRFSLDDTSVAVVTATLQALRAFLFSEADEVCLDRLLGWGIYSEPTLTPSSEDVNDTSNLKDHELAQLDTVAAALRSDIVLRIRYILSQMQPPPVGVTSALEILIRLARHSRKSALDIATTPYLLDIITKYFIPLTIDKMAIKNVITNAYGVPVVAAIKLCRVLICYGRKPVADRLENLNIIHSILSYVNNDSGKYGIHLCIESLRLWKFLLIYGAASESISGAQLILVSQLRLLLSNHDLGQSSELACEHAAALVAVTGYEPSLRSNIVTLLSKWSTQLASISSPTWTMTKLVSKTLIAVGETSAMNSSWISNIKIYYNICSSSNLLSDCVNNIERDPSSLPSLGVLTQDGQLQPIVSQNSCIPFLGTMLNAFCKSLCKKEILEIFKHSQFNRYIRKLEEKEWCLERSWYTRVEFLLVSAIVRCGNLLREDLNTETRHILWKISLKLISALPGDARHDIREMLTTALSSEKLKIEVLLNDLNNLHLDSDGSRVELELPNNLAVLYEAYNTGNGNWDQAAMPRDWLYLPLVNLYTKSTHGVEYNQGDEKVVAIVLSLELTLSDLVQKLSPNLRFSRLLLVYLCDTLFLNKNVSVLLINALTKFLKCNYRNLDFTLEVPGLSSFIDLFTALCEHFGASSYGNHGFAMALLVPIAQRHDVHYRKLLWSEHAGVLRYLSIPIEKLVIPLSEYLYPIESDVSMIETYITFLVRGMIKKEWSPVAYVIAMHHTAMYLKGTSKLATRMRESVEKMNNINLRNDLLNYVPPET
ncbi:RNA polymerase II-associated protein 1 [Cephus cinctus]|uniref:RNA polymerase II-associated protein 1 n=1 Tax=Cephus cinctus TaxID=211228 RepID=A0AAJ7VYB4_CEPCN|nr:RNA polymerase II-associated protein 1 [Cephus cinctus]XP_024937728.1 RNA polymerase II-associated protein 1 [Cephus cinctus]